MNRNRIIVANICLILMLVGIYLYMDGNYLSEQACYDEAIRYHYLQDYEQVMKLEKDNISMYFLEDTKSNKVSIVEVEKKGLFYRFDTMDRKESLAYGEDVLFSFIVAESRLNKSIYMEVIVRLDDAIEKVIVNLPSGDVVAVDEWYGNYAWYAVDKGWHGAKSHTGYDKDGHILQTLR